MIGFALVAYALVSPRRPAAFAARRAARRHRNQHAALGGNGGTDARSGRALSHAVLVWLGKISYSLYLWHWPIIVFATYYLVRELNLWEMAAAVCLMLALAGSVVALRRAAGPQAHGVRPRRRGERRGQCVRRRACDCRHPDGRTAGPPPGGRGGNQRCHRHQLPLSASQLHGLRRLASLRPQLAHWQSGRRDQWCCSGIRTPKCTLRWSRASPASTAALCCWCR